jgi:hypothetical protein
VKRQRIKGDATSSSQQTNIQPSKHPAQTKSMDSFNFISTMFAVPDPDFLPDQPTDADGNGDPYSCLIA